MARFTTLLVALGLLSTGLVNAQRSQEELDQINANSKCDNACFSSSFPGNSCAGTKPCMCDEQKYREAYFCCMATKCNSTVLPDSVIRQTLECEAKGLPFTFDSEAVCGVKMGEASDYMSTFISNSPTTKTSSAAASTKTSEATSSAQSSSSDPSASATESNSASATTATSTTSSQTIEQTSSSSAGASGTTSSSSTPTPTPNGSPAMQMVTGSAAAFALMAGMILW